MADVTYTCEACGQNFTDAQSLATHMLTYHTSETIQVNPGEEKQ